MRRYFSRVTPYQPNAETNEYRKRCGLPHQGAKESAKVYAEGRHPLTGHVTIRRVA